MSRIYEPQRVLGLVSNDVPSIIQTRGAEHFITTCVGRSFHTYSCKKLQLTFVSFLHEENINSLSAHKDIIITAAGNKISSFIRGKPYRSYDGHEETVNCTITLGDSLISTATDKKLLVHDLETGDIYSEAFLTCLPTVLLHPATYLNKILVGSKEGVLELWNIRQMKLIYQFKKFNSEITALCQSPGVDIIGIGFHNGQISLHNLKFDETLFTFQQDWGSVTCLAFRTDGEPHLVSGSTEGHLAVWDLGKQELHSTVHEAHQGRIGAAHYHASQPLLTTTGSDNALKTWVFDEAGGTARLLKERSGHHAPPTVTRFYGSSFESILSGGHDRSLRMFCVIRDARSKEFSQGSIQSKSRRLGLAMDHLKLTPVTAMAAEELRERDWSNVMTAHVGDRAVRLWSSQNGSLSTLALFPKLETIVVTAVAMTTCGNIGIVGYNSGHLTAFNLQSGINRGLFGCRTAHRGKITGVAVDAINNHVISTDTFGYVRFWDLHTRAKSHELKLEAGIDKVLLHRESNLLCCSLANSLILLLDIDTSKIVRRFENSTGANDICFSTNGKWLVGALRDSTVKIWDLVTAHLIDHFQTEETVTSVSMSRDGLVTTHHNQLGICSWVNKTLYENVELKPLPKGYTPVLVGSGRQEEMEVEGGEEADNQPWKGPQQISRDLITLSDASKSKWIALCNLNVIKKRNKPKEAPKTPKPAPFFMGTTKELIPKFIVDEEGIDEPAEEMKHVANEGESEFQVVLLREPHNTDKLLRTLGSMSLSGIDLELQSLSPTDGGSLELVTNFANFLIKAIVSRRNYDLLQSYLSVFLKHNRKYLMEEPELAETLAELKKCHVDTWSTLHRDIQKCLCVAQFIKSATL